MYFKQFLKQRGYGAVVSVRGGTAAWLAAGQPLERCTRRSDAPQISESA